ncbi:uncharacterized protein VP01_134g8 [Puccinia sorghi]|uniref:Integrase catalytic domain-containing protein n=1 Tax=Puccinia sorghi TaxID=27349 RepID=A0A0L6VM79_9BASI|nr:uncharacterized protein VP01_134g8 [Puccinia sorghi]
MIGNHLLQLAPLPHTPSATGSATSANLPSRSNNSGNYQPFRSATAPPRSNFHANLADLPNTSEFHHSGDGPTLQSITLDEANPPVTQEELAELIGRGGRLFGLDSCASHTFTNDLSILFETTSLINPLPLNVATNDTKSYVTTVGKMKLKNGTGSITLNNVYYSPNAACTLLSAETLRLGGGKIEVNDLGNASVSFSNGFSIQSFSLDRRWQVPAIVTSTCPPVVFVPPVNLVSESKHVDPVNPQITVMNSILKESDALMWHRRLGHTSLKRIIKMCSSGELPGLPQKLTNKDFICEDCLVSKSKRQRGSRLSDKGELQSMDVIVSDLLGPFVEGFSGVQYVVVFRDLATTYSEGFLLKSKKDICLTFKRYIERMERLTGKKLKVFRTDGGGEFTSKAFLDWMKDKGITHQHSMPYEPEQNGAAERLHRTVGEIARTA